MLVQRRSEHTSTDPHNTSSSHPYLSPILTQDLMHLRSLIQRHVKYTSSTVGRHILLDWDTQHRHFVKVGSAHCSFFLLELGWLLNRSCRTGTRSTATLQGGWVGGLAGGLAVDCCACM